MMDKDPFGDPFGYPILTYIWVIGLAGFASIIRYLNKMDKFSVSSLLIDAVSGGFTGLLTFWLCESSGIHGPLSAFLIGVSGLMGSRAWQEFANMLRLKFGLKAESSNGQLYSRNNQYGNGYDTGYDGYQNPNGYNRYGPRDSNHSVGPGNNNYLEEGTISKGEQK